MKIRFEGVFWNIYVEVWSGCDKVVFEEDERLIYYVDSWRR